MFIRVEWFLKKRKHCHSANCAKCLRTPYPKYNFLKILKVAKSAIHPAAKRGHIFKKKSIYCKFSPDFQFSVWRRGLATLFYIIFTLKEIVGPRVRSFTDGNTFSALIMWLAILFLAALIKKYIYFTGPLNTRELMKTRFLLLFCKCSGFKSTR